jgi:hypothetical protein
MVKGIGSPERLLLEEEVRTLVEEGTPSVLFDRKRVLVLTPDATRTCPLPMMIRSIQEVIGKRSARLDFMVALGTHTPLPKKDILSLYGIETHEKRFSGAKFFNHEWDRQESFARIGDFTQEEVEELSEGRLKEKVPIVINRKIFDYDLILIVGPVFPHEVVGYSGGATNLRLYGQDNNGGVWSMCKMNMLLHGIHDPEIHNDDTLWNPLHLDGGELMRFDRVITNPPFSQNYSKDGMKFPERFRYGFCPETGKKADLMFLQHMLSVLRTDGMLATVMPHGVLFRGSVEKEIRRGIIEDDLLEAVIGLPPNLFYGTGIPACILVCRAKGAKLDERKNRVLFINADAEFHAGRAQN